MSRLSGGSPSAPRWSASPSPRAPRFRRSELAAVGRRELLRWVNRTVGVEYVQVESCADGVALAQLVDAAYPDARVPLYRLDFATRHEHDRARNLEVVRATLDRLDLDVPLDVKEMSRGAYRACDEALRWLYLVVQRERPRSATRGYDGRARRLEALEKRRYLARAPSKSPGWRSAASWDDGSGGDSSLAAAASAAATAEDPDGDAPFSFSFRPRLSMDDGVAYSDGGSDGGRGLEMSVDSLDGPGEEDDPFSRAAARKETSRREKRTPLASVSVGNGKHKATTGAGAGAGAGAGPAVVRPATAPFARRRSTVSVVASARVDISPEPEPDPRRSPREEAEAEPSSGDENRSSRPRTPFVALSSLSPRPSSARLYTPRRSLDKWAEKARLKLESRERSSPRDADVPAFRASRDSEPRGRERRRAYEDASSSSSSVAADEPDAFGAFSRFTNWTTSPPGSAERAARLRREARAQALARTPRDAEARDGLNGGSGRSVEESTTRVRLARAEVAEIKAREAARRRRKEAERRARLEAEAEAEARAAEERRLEVEAEEAAQYAREVASARREVRLEEARARRARRRREVREALRLEEPIPDEAPDAPDSGRVPFSFSAADEDADAPSPSGAATAPAALARKRADLASLAEYLKWELAAELKRFEAAKRDTAAVVRERDDAILRLGIAETRRRLAGREPSAS